jgi:aldehyde:ferredoxin oxidoreductase
METGKIAWGDAEAVISLINGITAKNPESLIIGNGATAVGEFFHIERVPQVKGQSIPGYDPRTFKGMGITYLTSPMGADHTAGACIKGRKAYGDRDYGDLYTPEVKVELSRDLQIFTMLLDAMGLCYFIGPSWDTTQKLAELLKYRYGWNISPEELRRLGITYLQQEKEYNKKCGLPEVSSLPNFMLRENLEEIERTWDVPQSELDEYWVKLSK